MSGQSTGATWLGAAPEGLKLVDLAAGKDVTADALTEQQLVWASRHGLLEIVVDSMSRAAGPTALAHHARLSARQQVMEDFLRETLECLAEREVPVAVLKGPCLAMAYYRNPALRPYSDLDILVRPEDLERAITVLQESPLIGAATPAKRATSDKRDIPVYNLSKGVQFNVDLHWDLYSYTRLRDRAAGATAEAWARATPDTAHPLGPLWVLPREAELAFLCTHAWLDHRFRLILFRDLLEIAVSDRVDWVDFVAFAGRWRLRSLSYVSLLIASRLLGAPIPEDVLRDLRVPSATLWAIERMLPRADFVQFDGHSVHPLNLAAVALDDDPAVRRRTVLKAPVAFPGWKSRVKRERALHEPALTAGTRTSLSLIVASNRRRGAEAFGEQLALGLGRLGWDVDILALWDGGDDATFDAVTLSDKPPNPRLDPRQVWRLRRRLEKHKPALVLAYGDGTLAYTATALAGLRRRPLLAYGSVGEPGQTSSSRSNPRMQRRLYAHTDLVLASSERWREHLIRELGLDPEHAQTAPMGIDIAPFDGDRPHREGPLRVLVVEGLLAENDSPVAIRVLMGAAGSSDLRVRCVGNGLLRFQLEANADQLGYGDRFEFAAADENLRPQLLIADVLLLASQTEGFPSAVLEAAAAGVPAVAFTADGAGVTPVDGVPGVMIDRNNEVAAIDALVDLADRPNRVRQMGEEATRLAHSEFALERSVLRYDTILRNALSEHVRLRRRT